MLKIVSGVSQLNFDFGEVKMALDSAWATGSAVTTTTAATFIPEIWSDEILAEYEKSLVMKPLIKSIRMTGKKETRFTSLSPCAARLTPRLRRLR